MVNIDSKELQKLYIAYFCRPGDPSGINYWLYNRNEIVTLKEISNELSKQVEYIKYISNYSSFESQIHQLYLNLFSRKADFYGLNHWLDMVENENYKISDILYNLLYAPNEDLARDTEQERKDRNILENKVHAAEIFTNQINKSFTLIKLYSPDSLSPWIAGKSFTRSSNFINNIKHQKVSCEEVNNIINSIFDTSIEFNKPAIEMRNISLSIPIKYLEKRSLTKRFVKKVINITGGELSQARNGSSSIIALNNINLNIMKGERKNIITIMLYTLVHSF